ISFNSQVVSGPTRVSAFSLMVSSAVTIPYEDTVVGGEVDRTKCGDDVLYDLAIKLENKPGEQIEGIGVCHFSPVFEGCSDP
ncbi:unnamed protein product, partial [Allacma fusca]